MNFMGYEYNDVDGRFVLVVYKGYLDVNLWDTVQRETFLPWLPLNEKQPAASLAWSLSSHTSTTKSKIHDTNSQ